MSGTFGMAWRNIWRNRRRTLISMSAIGLGLLLVIFYSGLAAGVLGDARNQLDNAGLGHVEVCASGYRPRHPVTAVMSDPASWRGGLALPSGAEVGSRVLANGLATSARGNEPVQVMGVEWDVEPLLSAHLRHVSAGALPRDGDTQGVLVGEQLAERLGLKVGSKVRLMAQRADGDVGADLFRVRGIYHSIAASISKRQVYVSQAAARGLVGLEAGVHQLVIQLPEPGASDQLAEQYGTALGDRFEVRSYGQLFPILRRLEDLSNNVVFMLAFFVYLLVGLGVLNTMLMSVLERTREFGVLMALGTRGSRIVALVLTESFWVASVSVVFGALGGALLTWHFSRTGLTLMGGAAESFQMGGMTVSTSFKTHFALADVGKAAAFVYLMALVVGLYPASRIARLQPTEALRRT